MRMESKRIAEALRTSTASEESIDADLHQLAHDVQSCLHVIGLRTELLKGAREDEARFAEICDGIDKNRREAARLVTEYVRFARDGH